MMKLYAGAAAAFVAAVLGGSLYWVLQNRSSDPYAQCRNSVVGGGDIGGPFTLVDQTGATRTDGDVLAKPSLVYFGYTFCPDVCPLDNQRNAEAVDILEEMGLEVSPVFISVDPARDTPEALSDYAEAMHPRMIALTGSEEQIKSAASAYKAYYKVNTPQDEYYLVDHSTFTYLMLPEKGFVDFFKRELTPDELAEKVACYLRE